MPKIQNTPQEGGAPNTLLHEDEAFKDGFTILPNRVLRARNLSAPAKTLYAILLSYSWQADKCFPGYAHLCEDMGIGSRRILRKYIQELEQAKLLAHIRRGQGLTNIYILLSLKNALLETASQADGHRGDHQEKHTGDHLNGHRGEHKKDEVEENESEENEDSSKKPEKEEVKEEQAQPLQPKPTQTESTHTEGGQKCQGNATQQKKPQELKMAYIGKPLTQEEIDAKKRAGKNVSGYTPLAQIPPDHWQKLEADARNAPISQNGIHYNNCTKKAPVFIDVIIGQFTEFLGDEPENTAQNINRAAKLYRQLEMSEEDFRTRLYAAFDQARRYPTDSIQKKRSDGKANRMPVFFAILEERAAQA
jgi:hypothetical protein